MNFVFISKNELIEDSAKARICGPRALEVIKDHQLVAGLKVSCVVENAGRGKLTVTSCSEDLIEMDLIVDEPLPAGLALDLVVAYSRPQTMKKIFHLCTCLGVRSLSLVKTANVIAGYLQSKVLDKSEIRRQMILGCEQAGDAKFPEIYHFNNFYDFKNGDFVKNYSGQKLYGEISPQIIGKQSSSETLLLLGPESGLSSTEKQLLEQQGFLA